MHIYALSLARLQLLSSRFTTLLNARRLLWRRVRLRPDLWLRLSTDLPSALGLLGLREPAAPLLVDIPELRCPDPVADARPPTPILLRVPHVASPRHTTVPVDPQRPVRSNFEIGSVG